MQRVSIDNENYNILSKIKKAVHKINFFKMIRIAIIIGLIIVLLVFVRIDLLNHQTKKDKEITKAAIVYSKDVYGITNQNTYSIDFEKLKRINNDTVAWIKISGINFEYPIVQTKDNDFYLNHSFDKSTNKNGWIFMDYRNNIGSEDRSLVLYINNKKDLNIIESLKERLTEKNANTDIELWTQSEKRIYNLVSVSEVEYEDSSIDSYEESQLLTIVASSNSNEKRIVIHAVKE